jgi:hypothetical protein
MEKFLDYIDKSQEYKITLKNVDTPLYAFVRDIDSHFIYLDFPNNVPFIISVDDVQNIIPSKSGANSIGKKKNWSSGVEYK